MVGYNPRFLHDDVDIPMPTFTPRLAGAILASDQLRNQQIADYPHYSLVMNRDQRTTAFVAVNIDQVTLRNTKRRDNWRIDSRIGSMFQLDNDYYANNPWDRGHLARRDTAGWGDGREAQIASDETFYFTNSSLQHENFNQDEWLALEDWVKDLILDSNGKISVFSGPIWFDNPRSITPQGRQTALIPSAFFKVVCFLNHQHRLDVRAFMMTQDAEALADKSTGKLFDHQTYQVSVMDIEDLTGLTFPDNVAAANPMFFTASDATRTRLNISHTPERVETNGAHELIAAEDRRTVFEDDEVDVFIAAALVNPAGPERDGEWISIINLENQTIDLSGWTVGDTKRPRKPLRGMLGPGEALRIQPISPLVLANSGGVIELYNAAGNRIDRVKYDKTKGSAEGRPIVFAYRNIL
jgi:endonuclease G